MPMPMYRHADPCPTPTASVTDPISDLTHRAARIPPQPAAASPHFRNSHRFPPIHFLSASSFFTIPCFSSSSNPLNEELTCTFFIASSQSA